MLDSIKNHRNYYISVIFLLASFSGTNYGAANRIRTGDLVLTKEQSQNTEKEKHAYTSVQSVCYKPQYIVWNAHFREKHGAIANSPKMAICLLPFAIFSTQAVLDRKRQSF